MGHFGTLLTRAGGEYKSRREDSNLRPLSPHSFAHEIGKATQKNCTPQRTLARLNYFILALMIWGIARLNISLSLCFSPRQTATLSLEETNP
jgi:hypothetical protein